MNTSGASTEKASDWLRGKLTKDRKHKTFKRAFKRLAPSLKLKFELKSIIRLFHYFKFIRCWTSLATNKHEKQSPKHLISEHESLTLICDIFRLISPTSNNFSKLKYFLLISETVYCCCKCLFCARNELFVVMCSNEASARKNNCRVPMRGKWKQLKKIDN